jgi:hypothetical protein
VGESLSAFLGFANLPGTPALALSDGAAISAEVVGREHDDFDDGRSDLVTTYRFSALGPPETAETTLVLSVGGEP